MVMTEITNSLDCLDLNGGTSVAISLYKSMSKSHNNSVPPHEELPLILVTNVHVCMQIE